MSSERSSLVRFAWLSIAAAISTIALKAVAYWLTGSVGLLSDALESIVNLVAAVVALIMLSIAARPADDDHPHGHDKAEYFSSGVEGMMILVAALSITIAAVERLLHPRALTEAFWGLAISGVASVVNFVTARILLAAGRRHRSITLEADGHHLMSDVVTSLGVIVAVGVVWSTGWLWLDPLIAIAVALHIIWIGFSLLQRSVHGLMDASLPAQEIAQIKEVLGNYEPQGIHYHALRTRRSASRRFVSFHILVPGDWSVQKAHDLAEEIETKIGARLPSTTTITHIEPLEDPISWQDTDLDRSALEIIRYSSKKL